MAQEFDEKITVQRPLGTGMANSSNGVPSLGRQLLSLGTFHPGDPFLVVDWSKYKGTTKQIRGGLCESGTQPGFARSSQATVEDASGRYPVYLLPSFQILAFHYGSTWSAEEICMHDEAYQWLLQRALWYFTVRFGILVDLEPEILADCASVDRDARFWAYEQEVIRESTIVAASVVNVEENRSVACVIGDWPIAQLLFVIACEPQLVKEGLAIRNQNIQLQVLLDKKIDLTIIGQ